MKNVFILEILYSSSGIMCLRVTTWWFEIFFQYHRKCCPNSVYSVLISICMWATLFTVSTVFPVITLPSVYFSERQSFHIWQVRRQAQDKHRSFISRKIKPDNDSLISLDFDAFENANKNNIEHKWTDLVVLLLEGRICWTFVVFLKEYFGSKCIGILWFMFQTVSL